jgi:hypothetical protein
MFNSLVQPAESIGSRFLGGTVISVAVHTAVIVGAIAFTSAKPEGVEPLTDFGTVLLPPGPRPSGVQVSFTEPRREPRKKHGKSRERLLKQPAPHAKHRSLATAPEEPESSDEGGEEGVADGSLDSGGGGSGLGQGGGGGPGRYVAAFVLRNQLLEGGPPRLPEDVKQRYPRQEVHGTYQICIGRDGSVFSVRTVDGIPGADGAIISQLHARRYRPQALPLCTQELFVFRIN